MIFSSAIDINQLIPGAQNFTWQEALWLHNWNISYHPNQVEMNEIVATAAKMELIRAFLGSRPITVVSWIRPPQYNAQVGGAPNSAHIYGKAVDFHVDGMLPNDVRAALLPQLDLWQIRMEDLPNSSWTHIDIADVGPSGNRYFNPGAGATWAQSQAASASQS